MKRLLINLSIADVLTLHTAAKNLDVPYSFEMTDSGSTAIDVKEEDLETWWQGLMELQMELRRLGMPVIRANRIYVILHKLLDTARLEVASPRNIYLGGSK